MPKSLSSKKSTTQMKKIVHFSEDLRQHKSDTPKALDNFETEMTPATPFPEASLKQKAIGKVKSLLQQVLSPKAADILDSQERNQEQILPEAKAYDHLSKLFKLALNHPEYLRTEGVLRLLTNEVEKQTTLENMAAFFERSLQSIPSANILTVLIKHQIKQALSQEQKKKIIIDLGVKENELDQQSISDARFNEINQNLNKQPLAPSSLPFTLTEVIDFSKEIAKQSAINKMPPSTIAFSLAPCLLPELKNSAEYRITLLRFEMQMNSLLKSAFKTWIEN